MRKNKPAYTREETIAKLKELYEKGDPLSSTCVETRLKTSAVKHFGSWGAAKKFIGAPLINPGKSNIKYTDDMIKSALQKAIEERKNMKDFYTEHKTMCGAIQRRFGGVKAACEYFGLPALPRASRPPKRSKSELDAYIINRYKNGLSLSSNQVEGWAVRAAKRYYGGWIKALEAHNIKPENRRFETAVSVMRQFIKDGGDSEKYGSYREAINRFFGSVDNLRLITGMVKPKKEKLEPKPSKPAFRWTPELLKTELIKMIERGEPVNYTAVEAKYKHFTNLARKFFGSYRGLFDACGLDYDQYRADAKLSSYYGYQFEEIVASILSDLGVNYERQPCINGLYPDFVTKDCWIDAKLSRWTIILSNCDTVNRYEKYCDKLLILFLRGDKETDEWISEKTRVVSVYKYIDQLPEEKRNYYIEKLEEIERAVSRKLSAAVPDASGSSSCANE